ncbi:MAG: Asp-tRNA(Asn)/Glu-tRNA(Gln) amidotransferase subunit GatC [Candidatus Omnitrophota bacterium]|nr:Asp-tRNA(Asn)/Glu-tRNA(Gln) amidotransferase subunit GatC [Candidatus Omnitrophota bacterium]
MSINKQTIEQVAHLARINLPAKELEKLSSQLEGIIDFIGRLKKVNVDNIAPTSHILPINNVLREDLPGESLSHEKAMENAPQRQGSFFVVPRVIE